MCNPIDIKVLELLHTATADGLMKWVTSGEDQFASNLGDDEFEIELIYLKRSQEDSSERALVRIAGPSIYQTYAIGTIGYQRIMAILESNVQGWREGLDGYERKLGALQIRLAKHIAAQNSPSNEG